MKLTLPVASVAAISADVVDPALTPDTLKKNARALVRSPEGLARLESLLEKKFPQKKIVQYIQDLCEAEDIRLSKDGNLTKVPNWEARKNGLDRVLNLLRYAKKDNEPTSQPPSRIVFNIISQSK